MNITKELLDEHFSYHNGMMYRKKFPLKGWLRGERDSFGIKAGIIRKGDTPYYRVSFLGKRFYMSQLIWCMHYGSLPKGSLIYKDGNIFNNKIENLVEPYNYNSSYFEGVSIEELKEILYQKEDGLIYWKICIGNSRENERAGFFQKKSNSYFITINGKTYSEAQVVWALHKGYWSNKYILHRDRNNLNNKINNLFESDTPMVSGSLEWKTGRHAGTQFKNNQWIAVAPKKYLNRNSKKEKYLGKFSSEEKAIEAVINFCMQDQDKQDEIEKEFNPNLLKNIKYVSYNGEKIPLFKFCKLINCHYGTAYQKIVYQGMSVEDFIKWNSRKKRKSPKKKEILNDNIR